VLGYSAYTPVLINGVEAIAAHGALVHSHVTAITASVVTLPGSHNIAGLPLSPVVSTLLPVVHVTSGGGTSTPPDEGDALARILARAGRIVEVGLPEEARRVVASHDATR